MKLTIFEGKLQNLNIKHIFQIYDRILIIFTNWCLEWGDTGGRVDVVGV